MRSGFQSLMMIWEAFWHASWSLIAAPGKFPPFWGSNTIDPCGNIAQPTRTIQATEFCFRETTKRKNIVISSSIERVGGQSLQGIGSTYRGREELLCKG